MLWSSNIRAIAATAALLLAPALAQAAPTATANVSASIVDPVGVAQSQSLSVGATQKPKSGPRTVTAAAAAYSLTGPAGQNVQFSVPETLNLREPGGGELSMKLSAAPAPVGTRWALAEMWIGGSAPISNKASPGVYAGSYAVHAVYE